MEIELQEQPINHYINIFFCGTDFWSFIPTDKTQLVLTNGYYETTHQFLSWKYYMFEGLEQQTLNSMSQLIQSKCSMKSKLERNCVIICKTDSNIKETSISLIKSLQITTIKIYQPPIIFLSNSEETIIQIRSYIHPRAYDTSLISKISYMNNNPQALMASLFKASSYLNQLGDEYAFPVNSNSENGKQVFSIIEKDYIHRFNIILIGQPGNGKSTFINNALEEKRSLARTGMAVTNRIVQYKHKSKPIALYDTPGFNSEEETQSLLINIKDFVDRFKECNKDSIHLILFLINGDHNYLESYAVTLLKALYKLEIPLYFIVTRCDKPIGKLKEHTVRQTLIEFSFKNPKVIGIDQISYNGLKALFNQLYNDFSQLKYSKELINKLNDGTANEASYVDVFQSLFFNNQSKDDLILQSRQYVKTTIIQSLIGSFIYYAGLHIPILQMFLPEFTQSSMIVSIAECYSIEITEEDAGKIISSLNVQSLLQNFKDSDLANKLNVNLITNWFKNNQNLSKLDLEWLNKALRMLIKLVPTKYSENKVAQAALSVFVDMINIVIICFYAVNYFEAQIRKRQFPNDLLVKALNCYNSSIDFFLELAYNSKWANI